MKNLKATEFGVADVIIFIGTLVISALIGIYYAYIDRKNLTTDSYLFGDKTMSPISVSISMSVSFVSALTVLGIPVEAYYFGNVVIWWCLSAFMSAAFAAIFFVPLFRNLKISTIYEYLEMRFDKKVRYLCSTLAVFHQVMYMGIAVYLPAMALSTVTPISINLSIVLSTTICVFYTTVGGMKAVIWTDVFQALIMLVGSLVLFGKVIFIIGGLGNLVAAVERGERNNMFKSFNMDPRDRTAPFYVILGYMFNSLGKISASQVMVQRYMSCKDVKSARLAVYMKVLPICLFFLVAIANGLAMYAYYEGCDPVLAGVTDIKDQILPLMISQVFKNTPGLMGLFVAAAYSGTLSTVSSGINSLAAIAVNDYIGIVKPNLTQKAKNILSKITSVCFGVLIIIVSFVASLLGKTIVSMNMVVNAALGSPVFGLFVLAAFFPNANWKGAFYGLLIGCSTIVWIGTGIIIYKPNPAFTETLPLYTDSCPTINVTTEAQLLSTLLTEYSRPWIADTLYSISPYGIGCFGWILSVFFGLIISKITGGNGEKQPHPDLVVQKEYLEIPLLKSIRSLFCKNSKEITKAKVKWTKVPTSTTVDKMETY